MKKKSCRDQGLFNKKKAIKRERARTGFEEDNLVVLGELHEAGHHLRKLNYLLDHVRQLSGALQPLVLV